jgi:hypothetical protein
MREDGIPLPPPSTVAFAEVAYVTIFSAEIKVTLGESHPIRADSSVVTRPAYREYPASNEFA